MRIKILFPYTGNSFGGSHVSSSIFLKNCELNFHIYLFEDGEFSKILKKENKLKHEFINLNYVKSNFIIKKFFQILISIRLVSFLKNNNFDIVHTNDIPMHLTWFLPSLLSKTKHVWHQRTPNNKAIFLSLFSNLLTISNYTKNSFPIFLQKKATVIYNPFEVFKFSKKEISKTPKIGFVGNLIKRKNVDVFIKIIANLDNNFKGIIFGEKREPVYTDAIKEISNLKIKDKIDFKGLVFPIEKYLSKIDILIAPATDEAFGRNLVEAMMLGIPVLALDYGGHKEIIENGVDGFLIKNNNIDVYIEKIKLLVDNPDVYQIISKKAHLKAKNKFGVDMHVKKMIKCYNEILIK